MTNVRARVSIGRGVSVVLLPVAMLACGGGGGGGSTGAGNHTGGGSCPTSTSNGTLSIHISGTPSGHGLVSVGGQQVTSSTVLTLSGGSQSLVAFIVAEGGTLVRTAYEPTIDFPTPCVLAGQTTPVNVTYAPIPTSGKVWTGASDTPTAGISLLGYSESAVTVNGSLAALIAADTGGAEGFTFDPQGDVWVTGSTTGPAVTRYPASLFSSGGAKVPDAAIDSPAFTGSPGPSALALDSLGDLWVSVVAADKVVKFTPDLFDSTTPVTPAVEEAGIPAPEGLAFDTAGNLWIASAGSSTALPAIVRIDAAHLGTSGTGADLTIHAMTPSPVVGTLPSPYGIAFDADGNLWVNYDGVIARLDAATLTGTGTMAVTPTVQIGLDVQALPLGIAFDEAGGLWFAYTAGKFGRLAASQLTASGSNVIPQVIIDGSDLGYAGWFAIYPAPAFTPLAHALP